MYWLFLFFVSNDSIRELLFQFFISDNFKNKLFLKVNQILLLWKMIKKRYENRDTKIDTHSGKLQRMSSSKSARKAEAEI
jgi:hypothetical protein